MHVSELPDIAHLLCGGELILTTGIGLSSQPDALASYLADIAAARASGLVIELGRHFEYPLPRAMLRAAGRLRLPVVVLRREVQFVTITEAVHTHIINTQLQELRVSEQLYETFVGLSIRGAPASEIVAEVARLAGAPVVLEDLVHRLICCDPASGSIDEVLEGWEGRSKRAHISGHTDYAADAGLLVTMVGARRQDWGRLLMLVDHPPTTGQVVLMERGATALALRRLAGPLGRDSPQLEAHRTIINCILEQRYTAGGLSAVVRAAGIQFADRSLVGLAVRPREPAPESGAQCSSALSTIARSLGSAAREARLPMLVGPMDVDVLALTALPGPEHAEPVVRKLAARLRHEGARSVAVGVGSAVESPEDAHRSLAEARLVAEVSAATDDDTRQYWRLSDLGIRSLLYPLCGDARLQSFVERELGPLFTHDAQYPRDPLLPILGAYISARGNKTTAASSANLSRPAFYQRLTRIQRILGCDLESSELLTSLHAALIAYEMSASPGRAHRQAG